MNAARLHCVLCEPDQVVPITSLVIDDETETYRTSCPTCGTLIEHPYTVDQYRQLRAAGVRTISEHCQVLAAMLGDDRLIWRGLGMPRNA